MNTDPSRASSDIGSRLLSGLMLAVLAAGIYILSFGPVFRLTSDKVGPGQVVLRNARFPGWRKWTFVVYRPLFSVLGGKTGHWPGEALLSYVLWWG
jgi:hypothetical protein